MDKEKKERGVTVTGGGASEAGAQAETITEGAEAGKGEDGKESEKRGKAAKKGIKAGKKQ